MREDRHNSCIMTVTSEPFMIYLCILFVTGLEMFLLTHMAGGTAWLIHEWKQNKMQKSRSICPSLIQVAGQTDS